MTKKYKLPAVSIPSHEYRPALPYNGSAVTEKSLSFSFSCFDRTHELFNLGEHLPNGIVSSRWFLDLLECLKSVSNKTREELKRSSHDLHPVDWSAANTSAPVSEMQQEYWQFRLNKSRGRVIGFIIDGIFYIVWLDPHHNLTDSEGYGKAVKYHSPKSLYEIQEEELEALKELNKILRSENDTYRILFDSQ